MGDTRTISRRSGLATVELAILLPVLLTLTFGMIEYGWLFLKAQEVTNAAREGARAAIIPSATNTTVQAAVGNLMTSAGLGGSGYSVTLSPTDVSSVQPGSQVSVTIVVPGAGISPVSIPLIPMPGSISAAAAMTKEGS